MDVASFLLTKENEPVDANDTGVSSVSCFVCGGHKYPYDLFVNRRLLIEACCYLKENQKAWSVSLNGYNIEDAKILHLGGKPLNAPEGKYACMLT